MSDIRFKPFKQQWNLLKAPQRFKLAAASKRSGKSECGAVQAIKWQEEKPNPKSSYGTIDPYLGIIAAPTHEMLRDLSWKKFMAYAKPFIKREWQSPLTVEWHDGSEVRGVSADRPERLEGKKVHWGWVDEVFQVSEQFYLEMIARTSDTEGYILATGSLGIQYINPKAHWAYRTFKQSKDPNVFCIEWSTKDNPYFPQQEITRLKETLDQRTFDAMFDIKWDTIAKNAVYSDWSDKNECSFEYDPELPLYVSIDWGWAHPMAVLFIQYNPRYDHVYVIDEIIQSKLKLEHLWLMIKERGYEITDWCCDIAGNQEREQTGISNVEWFENTWKREGLAYEFKCRSSAVNYGVSLVRRYIRTASGQTKLFVNPEKCPTLLDHLKNYRYPEREGILLNENPVKELDDGCFVAGTMIETNKGRKPIESLSVGDMVLTRDGFAPVIETMVSAKPVHTYALGDRELTCTSTHKIHTENRGFVPACELTPSDTVSILKNQCEQRRSNLTESLTTDTQILNSPIEKITTKHTFMQNYGALAIFTEMFINIILAPFLMASIFITKMVTSLTTLQKILKPFLHQSIVLTTLENTLKTIEKKLSKTLTKYALSLAYGISQMKDAGIIGTLALLLGKQNKHQNIIARSATKNLRAATLILRVSNSARTIANLKQGECLVWITKLVCVKIVMQNTPATNTQNKNAAPENARLVYNITVKNKHEYFANGILVKNCDSLRYFFMNFLDGDIDSKLSVGAYA